VINIRGLTKRHGAQTVLDGVDAAVVGEKL
jgi:hypothetical protein